MSAYEELVRRSRKIALYGGDPLYIATDILAEVLRTLETVTPEMRHAWDGVSEGPDEAEWLAMLRASPLAPPAGAP